jgi:hypothetical protein
MKPETMPAYPATARRSTVNLAYSALLFAVVGWTIMERWSLDAHTGAMPHVVSTLACAPVLACALLRFHAACPRHMRSRARPPGAGPAGVLATAILFGVGAGFGMAVGTGSMSAIVLLAAICCLTPWTRLRAHQQPLILSLLAAAVGALLALGQAAQAPSLMVALPAAWCLWTLAAGLCIGLCGQEMLRNKGRSR